MYRKYINATQIFKHNYLKNRTGATMATPGMTARQKIKTICM